MAGPARADTLDEILERGGFTWGADEEGGGPFIFPDPADPARRTGFEVDLAAALAAELTRSLGRPIEARFCQAQWDKLPDLLKTGRIDLVLNGYEWSPERAQVMASTVPYYVYELQLLARAGDGRFAAGWDALLGPERLKVGVLGGSAAERHVAERYPAAELKSYDGNTNAMGDVVKGRLDATVQDLPIAAFYGKEFPALRVAGEPAAPGRYVIFVRKEDGRLREALDRAILALRDRGALREIYGRYGIWTRVQEDPVLTSLPAATVTAEALTVAGFLAKHGRTFLEAAGMTVLLSLVSMPLAILLGILVALGRLYGPRPLSLALAAYVEALRGTPLMLQLFVIFYVFPAAGIRLDAFAASVLGLAVNYSAYEAEIYRAGLQAVHAGQMEAALALGMSRGLALRRIVIPQAVRIVIPAVTNDFIALFKDTSVCSVITVVELTKRYNIAAMTHPAEVLPLAAVTGLLYLAMSYPLSVFSRRMERRLHG
ncbi:MAG: ABC transporter permease subunit [Planctomycetes bacterium]|nr:ABC transporter permease subunit [Planctomycetota bacterium]